MRLHAGTRLHQLLKDHPYLEEFLVGYHPRFELLRSRAMRATVGRVATLQMVAGTADLSLDDLLRDVAQRIEERTGEAPEVDASPATPDDERAARLEVLEGVIRDLHDGGDLDEARQRFAVAVEDVGAEEIAAMEQQLIRGGMPVAEVQRLCDVHVGAFRELLDQQAAVEAPPGHPADTLMAENRRIEELLDALGRLAPRAVDEVPVRAGLGAVVDELAGIDGHYTRKENQWFPALERHGIEGPTQVMWGVHDEIRAQLGRVSGAAAAGDWASVEQHAPELARAAAEMIYKEEKILLPLCLETLGDDEWIAVRRGEDELGYPFAVPGTEWPAGGLDTGDDAAAGADGLLPLQTGQLSLEQVDLMLTHLPVDLSFVDEDDVVRYYSEGERHFPRSPGVIGRRVQNCHPPKSVDMVQRILDAFRAGERDTAAFWIQLHGKFLYIRYFAVRDAGGAYRGCLEVGQDVGAIRQLQGERRLLEWDDAP